MKKKSPQDDTREEHMRQVLKLQNPNTGRSGIDAIDECGNHIELKSTCKENRACSTARDLNHKHLERWRNCHWVVAYGVTYDDGFSLDEYYYLSPEQMAPWVAKIEGVINDYRNLSNNVIQLVQSNGYSHEQITKLRSMHKRGATLNDPNIPFQYVKRYGIRLTAPYDVSLRRAMKHQPKKKRLPTVEEVNLMKFFT